jgi:hypothetical protein
MTEERRLYDMNYYQQNKERIKLRNEEYWKRNRELTLPDFQICTTCGIEKPIEKFSFLKRKYKYELQCRECKYKQSKNREGALKQQGLCIACKSVKENLDKKYCSSCNAKYARKSKSDRLSAKRKAIEYLGGRCQRCDLSTTILDVYDFHHISPDKEMNLGGLLARHRALSKKVMEELGKCILLCANCHRIIHWELNNKEGNE